MDADDNVELDEIEVEPEEMPEEPEQDPDQSGDEQEGDESGDDEVTVSIGDEPPEEETELGGAAAPEWVKKLRTERRELIRRNRELEAKQAEPQASPQAEVLGPYPLLEHFDYDEKKKDEAIAEWFERKRRIEDAEAQSRKAQEAELNEWKSKLERFEKQKRELKVSNLAEADAVVEEHLTKNQRGIIISGASNAAQIFAALGNNPKRLSQLAAITNPIEFAFAAGKLETELKVQPRKTAPIPDRVVRGSAPVPKGADKKLAELEAKADKTGDRTEYLRYKKALSSKG